MRAPSMARLFNVCAFCMLIIAGLGRTTGASSYNVGSSAGWDISADLGSWVAGKTFYVGDALVFQYSKYHSLNEVDAAGYNNCNTSNAIHTWNDRNTTVPLGAPGDRYFVCGNEMHCLGGMKLHVLIDSPAGAPAGAPQSSPQTNPVAPAPGPNADDGALATLMFGGSQRLRVGPALVTWLCIVTVLFV